jgi:N-acetylneuraminic acid mutarotase
LEDPLDIHCLRLEKNQHKWDKLRLKCSSKELELVSGHAGAIKDNRWYMFGGINQEFRANNLLWRLNIDSLELTKLEGIGVPTPRESASLFAIDHNWLLLYGGANTNAVEIYNDFHLYNISSKTWSHHKGSLFSHAYPRYDPALCQFK